MQSSDALDERLARYGALIQAEMRAALEAYTAPADFYGMMRYHLGWADEHLQAVAAPQGKGLRGALLLLVNDAYGGDDGVAAPLAAAIELLHNFSLVHDDIEDGSATRRHRPTAWSLWGAPLGINMGDGLYALAHLALYRSPLRQDAPRRFIEITRRFEQAALRLCEGQHLDMCFEQAPVVAVEEYLRMIGGKSATLIAACAWMGAYAAGAAEAPAEAAYRFGFDLGLAFQMQDDLLGLWGDEAMTGKSAASDLTTRKKSLPVLLAMSAPDNGERLCALYAEPPSEANNAEIRAMLDGSGARQRTQHYVRRHWEASLTALGTMDLAPPSDERLRAVALRFVERVS